MLHRTERLLLREFTAADWPAVLDYHRDPRYPRFGPEGADAEAEVRGLVQMFVGWQHERPRARFQWAVLLPGGGQIIGNCGIRKPAADAREADIGFELAPAHWGRGYATELAAALLRYGFEELGLERIMAHVEVGNLASARVLEKVGMRPAGGLRYGILPAEWRAARAREA
jgi:RimJ/RimL family protein N-acetyltransferase